MKTPTDNRIRVTVRVAPDTFETLKKIASEQSRTVNFQIEHYIRSGIRADQQHSEKQ